MVGGPGQKTLLSLPLRCASSLLSPPHVPSSPRGLRGHCCDSWPVASSSRSHSWTFLLISPQFFAQLHGFLPPSFSSLPSVRLSPCEKTLPGLSPPAPLPPAGPTLQPPAFEGKGPLKWFFPTHKGTQGACHFLSDEDRVPPFTSQDLPLTVPERQTGTAPRLSLAVCQSSKHPPSPSPHMLLCVFLFVFMGFLEQFELPISCLFSQKKIKLQLQDLLSVLILLLNPVPSFIPSPVLVLWTC